MANLEDKRVFIDTNLLIYTKLEKSEFHKEATHKINKLFEDDYELWISRQIIREYLSWITREESLRDWISKETLQKDIIEFQENFQIADETTDVTNSLLDLFKDFKVYGKQIHDANIVATMKTYNINKLLTYNIDDFKRFSSIIILL